MNCQVSLIVDDVKPYQKTQPTGHNSTADYTSWKYDLTSQYTTIKEGTNKITAKLFCHNNSTNVSKFYSVNVTGVASASNQVSSNMSNTNRTANGTGKVGPLPQKQNVTAESTLPKSVKHSPHALDVNGILANTGILASGQTNNTAAISEKHHGHHPAKAIGENSNPVISSSSDEKSLATHQNEKNSTSSPVGNSTGPNSTNTQTTSTNSITASGVPTATAGTVSIPTTTTNNNTAGTVSIPTTTTNNNTAGTGKENGTVGRQTTGSTPFVFPSTSPYVRNSTLSTSTPSVTSRSGGSQQLPPVANVGPDQVVAGGSAVILNGSGSMARGGVILSYSWTQIPTSATITLSGVNTPVWEFTAPNFAADTLLRFRLTVTDNLGQTGVATVNVLDKASPRANTPPHGLITNAPLITSAPLGVSNVSHSVITPFKSQSIMPPLTPPVSPQVSAQTSPQVSAQTNTPTGGHPHNHSPTANAGHDQTVQSNSTVLLVGSSSKDQDGDALTYHWAQITGKPAINLGGANTPVWEFRAPNVATDTSLTFQLTVTDTEGLSDTGTVNVVVKGSSPSTAQTNFQDTGTGGHHK